MSILRFMRALLSFRDWVYLLGLLIPFVAYDLALKVMDVLSRPDRHGLLRTLGLVQSDAYFCLGYALLWIGLFAAVRGRRYLRRVVVLLFHAATLLVVIATTSAHQYFQETGATLDYGVVALWITKGYG